MCRIRKRHNVGTASSFRDKSAKRLMVSCLHRFIIELFQLLLPSLTLKPLVISARRRL